MQLRISTGKYKNKKLKVADPTLPVRERVKLAVFSILEDKVIDAKCLDLYAGSGSLGFEALSRGAKSCVFIEQNKQAIGCLLENKDNIFASNEDEKDCVEITRADGVKYVSNTDEYYDIIFLDPPYDASDRHIIKMIEGILNKDGVLIFFHHKKDKYNVSDINENLKIHDSRIYGITQVDFIVRK